MRRALFPRAFHCHHMPMARLGAERKSLQRNFFAGAECQKSGGAGGTASCRGYRGGAPKPCAAALFPQTSLRVRSTEDEDSPKGYRSPKPAARSGAGRKALFAGADGQLGVFDKLIPQRKFPCRRKFLRNRRRIKRTHFPFKAASGYTFFPQNPCQAVPHARRCHPHSGSRIFRLRAENGRFPRSGRRSAHPGSILQNHSE